MLPGINRTTRDGGATGYEFLLIRAVGGFPFRRPDCDGHQARVGYRPGRVPYRTERTAPR